MATMPSRTLGRSGPTVSAMGLGCMGMSEFYGELDDRESIATIHRALDLGVTFLDTADMYGPLTNEALVGRARSRSGYESSTFQRTESHGETLPLTTACRLQQHRAIHSWIDDGSGVIEPFDDHRRICRHPADETAPVVGGEGDAGQERRIR